MRWDDLGLIWRRRRRGCICFKVSRLQRNRLLFDLGGVLFAPLQSFAHPFAHVDRKSTRLNSSHDQISYAVFCLKKKKDTTTSDKSRSVALRTPGTPDAD